MAQQILIKGQWCDSQGTETFKSVNPRTTEQLEDEYPVSPWNEIDDAVKAAYAASVAMRGWPGSRFADFLDANADGLDQRAAQFGIECVALVGAVEADAADAARRAVTRHGLDCHQCHLPPPSMAATIAVLPDRGKAGQASATR